MVAPALEGVLDGVSRRRGVLQRRSDVAARLSRVEARIRLRSFEPFAFADCEVPDLVAAMGETKAAPILLRILKAARRTVGFQGDETERLAKKLTRPLLAGSPVRVSRIGVVVGEPVPVQVGRLELVLLTPQAAKDKRAASKAIADNGRRARHSRATETSSAYTGVSTAQLL